MKKTAYFVCFYLLMLVPSYSSAGSIDLSVEIAPSPITNVSSGDIGEFSIIITNNGPDDAGADSSLSFPVTVDTERIFHEEDGSHVAFDINPNISQNCVLQSIILDPAPGGLVSFIYAFRTPVIPAGSSVSCYGIYYFNYDNDGVRSFPWRSNSSTDNDTNSANDGTLMVFQGRPLQVSSLSFYGLLILMLVVFLIGYRATIKR